jgi:hypothetical protein
LNLIVNLATLTKSASGTVWGEVYFEHQGGFFPGRKWTDMVIPFLTAWLKAIATVGKELAPKSEAWFMDGPFLVKLSLLNRTTAVMKGFRDANSGLILEASSSLPLHELLAAALATGRTVEALCEEKGWRGDRDILLMKRALSECQQLLDAKVGNA